VSTGKAGEETEAGGDADTPRWFVSSLERGLKVIRCFGADAPLLRVAQVAQRTGMSRAAARRFLMTLEALGYVGCDSEQRYYLKASALSLGYSYLSSLRLGELAQPVLQSVMERSGQSCSLVVLDDLDIVYLARAIAYRPLHMFISPGDRLPAYAASMGRVLLAGLPPEALEAYFARATFKAFTVHTLTDPQRLRAVLDEVRRQGFAMVEHEIALGIVSVAVPVAGRDGTPIAAINVNSQAGSATAEEMMRDHLPLLRSAAAEIGTAVSAVDGTQGRWRSW